MSVVYGCDALADKLAYGHFGWALDAVYYHNGSFVQGLAVGGPHYTDHQLADGNEIGAWWSASFDPPYAGSPISGGYPYGSFAFFGYSVAVGNFANTGDEVAIGAPNADVGAATDAGKARINHLDGSFETEWNQDTLGIPDVAEALDNLGTTLTTGDFNGDGYADLVMGVPEENLGTTDAGVNAGIIHVLYGSSAGLTRAGTQVWSQKTSTTPLKDKAEANDRFGGGVWG